MGFIYFCKIDAFRLHNIAVNMNKYYIYDTRYIHNVDKYLWCPLT